MFALGSHSYAFGRYGSRMADMSQAQNARARAVALRLLAGTEYKNRTALAKALGVASASLSNFLNGKNGISYQTADKLAELAGTTRDAMIGPPGVDPPKPALRSVELDDRYPTRAALLNQSANIGRWDAPAVAAAMSWALDSDDDPGEPYWEKLLDSFQVTSRGLGFALPKSRSEPVNMADFEKKPGGRFTR